MDIIGPLPTCEGFRYCLTLIDRFLRWVEAIPLRDITAQTVARAFFDGLISQFGAPKILTTDRGAQFESQLFAALLSLIGCKRIHRTAFHPAANGIIERWHKALKDALMCHANQEWTRILSTVLLGLRTHIHTDTGASACEYLYGTSLRIPVEFFLPEDLTPDPNVLEEVREHMWKVRTIPVAHHHRKRAFVFKDLQTCTHVFLRAGPIKKALERPYTGPHKIIERVSERVYNIDINGTSQSVAVERLKPAYFVLNNLDVNLTPHPSDQEPSASKGSKQLRVQKTYTRKKVSFATEPKTTEFNEHCNLRDCHGNL
ncbi:PREDICTED: uncharacterized protein LOC107191997 [Dufourea novaeangliae]|uniref:uncharacterized protein LOC107191997 n=1 Tax=Dufourea novaeangliae TaxID=178035 RepID=UPI000767C652|nr:PREDICTED: uncharacterized protein LOC107191997 [Dufourea novaeangliae]